MTQLVLLLLLKRFVEPSIIQLPHSLYPESPFHRSSSELPTATYARLPITAPPFTIIDLRPCAGHGWWPCNQLEPLQIKNLLAKVKSLFCSIFHLFQHRSSKRPPTRFPLQVFLFVVYLSYSCYHESSYELSTREGKVIVFESLGKPHVDIQHVLARRVEEVN
jgi:hypothetical protein